MLLYLTNVTHRKKLELQQEALSFSRVDGAEHIRDVHEPEPETQSIFQVEVPPWAESYNVSSVNAEGHLELVLCVYIFTDTSG